MLKAVELLNDDSTECTDATDENLYDQLMPKDIKLFSIASMKCAAHTLQLAVKDFCKHVDSLNFIDKARKIVKVLRNFIFIIFFIFKQIFYFKGL